MSQGKDYQYQNGDQKGLLQHEGVRPGPGRLRCRSRQKGKAQTNGCTSTTYAFEHMAAVMLPSNLITLCQSCHNDLHAGKFHLKAVKISNQTRNRGRDHQGQLGEDLGISSQRLGTRRSLSGNNAWDGRSRTLPTLWRFAARTDKRCRRETLRRSTSATWQKVITNRLKGPAAKNGSRLENCSDFASSICSPRRQALAL